MAPLRTVHCWLIDHTSGSLVHQETGEQRRLGEYQLKLLQVLADRAGETLTREDLTHLVWENRVIGNNSLPNAIHALRVALEDNGKQQRIIKTVPKKGYMLEPAFCHSVSEESSPALPPATSAAAVNEENTTEEAVTSVDAASQQETYVPAPTVEQPAAQSGRSTFWRWLVPAQGLLFVVLLLLVAKNYLVSQPVNVTERNSVAWSNIRVVEVTHSGDSGTPTGVSKRLDPVLFALNQQLKARQVSMDVFISASGPAFSYTMTLKNSCDRRQLAMNITNWRTDILLLKALVYRESERKINEMANCVTQPAAGNRSAAVAGSKNGAAAVQ